MSPTRESLKIFSSREKACVRQAEGTQVLLPGCCSVPAVELTPSEARGLSRFKLVKPASLYIRLLSTTFTSSPRLVISSTRFDHALFDLAALLYTAAVYTEHKSIFRHTLFIQNRTRPLLACISHKSHESKCNAAERYTSRHSV